VKNHLYPKFHLKNWDSLGGKILDKNNSCIRKIELGDDFTKNRYYWIDNSPDLEIRFGKFECYISNIINEIINATSDNIEITSKQLYLLKLYCKFAAERQENTTYVIKEDEFGLYENNDYQFGTFIMNNRSEVLIETQKIIEKFEKVINDKCFRYIENQDFDNIKDICDGVHLVILRNAGNHFCLGNVFGLIENTSDNDHLYFYLPVSPNISLMLVNSEYYLDKKQYDFAKRYLPRKFHVRQNMLRSLPHNKQQKIDLTNMDFFGVKDDEYLSYVIANESILFNSYYHQDILFTHDIYNIKIQDIYASQVYMFNSIIYEDSNEFIFINKEDIKKAKKIKAKFRKIRMQIM
jgi:hypothetical protein